MAMKEEKVDEIDERMLEGFIIDSDWLAENYENIRTKHLEKFVAVKNKKVIAESQSIGELQELLKKQGVDPRTTLVDFMLPKDTILFL